MDNGIEKYQKFFNEFWQLFKKYYPPPKEDGEYWDDMFRDFNDLYFEYQKSQMVGEICKATMDELEHISKGARPLETDHE